ncbi:MULTISPECIES: hypothetical protein [unclassified Anaerobiospirillum]|uniref:hypothetical protein n=1 Tax=unclassified Anaerobiospirillum TaxID=2647410 RepID=UPI001FF5FC69|nr:MULTISPECIES: hypothetical protein [unclassified Anaerobiospirillum]MCK0535391.1 hypothetical protein [Anaerobiospirillum sp. NML120511]MCK0539083.1 hypothetical protein [Anaerobiospirillum sp. NML02-A-032]
MKLPVLVSTGRHVHNRVRSSPDGTVDLVSARNSSASPVIPARQVMSSNFRHGAVQS